jgi:thioester reductase-like protein
MGQVIMTGSKKIFLTGVTGFIGKVVLEELLRREKELDLGRVYLLIRPGKKNPSPQGRFDEEVVSSPCFQFLPSDWTDRVHVLAGDLTQKDCGLGESERKLLFNEVTHIINCAASVEFDLPVQIAASSNILSSLNVLELAKQCVKLKSMVSVSTAYVTPYRQSEGRAIGEYLVPLRRPAREIYRDILEGRKTERELLSETGHPNTYTLTKCLAEHLLEEAKGRVPLRFVRPSIVSAAWRHPFPGWIDSHAAFAGFVALIGSGYMRAVIAQYDTFIGCGLWTKWRSNH